MSCPGYNNLGYRNKTLGFSVEHTIKATAVRIGYFKSS